MNQKQSYLAGFDMHTYSCLIPGPELWVLGYWVLDSNTDE